MNRVLGGTVPRCGSHMPMWWSMASDFAGQTAILQAELCTHWLPHMGGFGPHVAAECGTVLLGLL